MPFTQVARPEQSATGTDMVKRLHHVLMALTDLPSAVVTMKDQGPAPGAELISYTPPYVCRICCQPVPGPAICSALSCPAPATCCTLIFTQELGPALFGTFKIMLPGGLQGVGCQSMWSRPTALGLLARAANDMACMSKEAPLTARHSGQESVTWTVMHLWGLHTPAAFWLLQQISKHWPQA